MRGGEGFDDRRGLPLGNVEIVVRRKDSTGLGTHPPIRIAESLEDDGELLLTEHPTRETADCRRPNHRVLVDGMSELGFETLVPAALQAPIIVTFLMPADPRFVFATFYDRLRVKGFIIYPGKLTVADSFRTGCIGRTDENDIRSARAAIRSTLIEMGVASGAASTAHVSAQ